MNENKIKVPSIIELYSGPFGCGKTTKLIDKFREAQKSIDKSRKCYFFMLDGLCEIYKEKYKDIAFLPFSSAYDLCTGNNDSYFIDNIEVFIYTYGMYKFNKILGNVGGLYMSCINQEFQESIVNHHKDKIEMIKQELKIELQIIKYIESLYNSNTYNIKMKDNPGLPKDYIQQMKEIYQYEE